MNDYLIREEGTYTHYKGGNYIYLALGSVASSEDMYVIYKSVDDGIIWCRPSEMFHDWVDNKGKFTSRIKPDARRRFKLTHPFTPSEKKKIIPQHLANVTTVLHSETGLKMAIMYTKRGNIFLEPILEPEKETEKNKIMPVLSKI